MENHKMPLFQSPPTSVSLPEAKHFVIQERCGLWIYPIDHGTPDAMRHFFCQTMCVGTSLQKLIFEVYVCLKECSSKKNYHQKARLSEFFRNVQHINLQQVAVAV